MTPSRLPAATSYIIDGDDKAAVDQLNKQLMQTEITSWPCLATDLSMTRLPSAGTASGPTWSWATASVSTARSSPPLVDPGETS